MPSCVYNEVCKVLVNCVQKCLYLLAGSHSLTKVAVKYRFWLDVLRKFKLDRVKVEGQLFWLVFNMAERAAPADGMDHARLRSNLNHSQVKQEYYSTLASPLTRYDHMNVPWPLLWLLETSQCQRIRKIIKGEVVATMICLMALLFSLLSAEALYTLVFMFKTATKVCLPPLLALNLFFWLSKLLTRYNYSFSLGYILCYCALQELYCEVFVGISELKRCLVGVVFFPTGYSYIVSAHHGHNLPSLGIISILAVLRFGIYGLFKSFLPSLGYMHLVAYLASFVGLHLGTAATVEVSRPSLADNMDTKFTVIRRRRESSVDSTMSSQSNFSVSARQRRTSLPVMGLPSRRVSMSSMDLTTLGEAHGMITDMLADPSLPPYVIGTLRVIGDMISPLLQHGFQRAPFSSPLVTVMEKSASQVQEDEAKVIDQPDLKDDTPLSLRQRLSRQLGVNVRRMSSSYTTTTSATGMPTLDHEYRSRNSTHSLSEAMPSRSPSPKVSQRAKSYAGIFPAMEPRREFIKSRSFCQTTSPLVRQDIEVRQEGDSREADEGIFKAEVACSGESFMDSNDSHYNYRRKESSEVNRVDIEVDGQASWGISSKSDQRHTYEVRFEEDTHDVSRNSIEKDVRFDLSNGDDSRGISDSESRSEGVGERGTSLSNSSSKLSPLAQRRTENLTVAQVAPVRKNSRDETASRRTSRDSYLSVPRRSSSVGLSSRLSAKDIQHELDLSCQENVSNILNRVQDWEFPVFDLAERCNVLTQLALRIFQVSGFFRKFNIPQDAFINYFRNLEEGYHHIPYHNKIHAADVLHGVFYLTNQKIPGFSGPAVEGGCGNKLEGVSQEQTQLSAFEEDHDYGCLSSVIPELELMALYTAAAMHDFDHPGRTNAFLVATLNPKALLYNDRSVLENHHAAASWSLLVSDPNNNFLSGLDSLEFKRFRFIVIEEILSTDLKRHFDFLSEWNAKTSDQSNGINFGVEADRLLIGQMCMKLADISGPSKNWDLHYRWTDRIVEEFYLQGDEELSRGMPISAYMDRSQPRVAQLQESFIKHLVGPLYNTYCRAGLLPGEWVEAEGDEDDDDDTESGASPSIATDSNSDPSDGEDDIILKMDRDSLNRQKVKKRVPTYPILLNLEANHETWQEKIRVEQEANAELTEEDENATSSTSYHNTIAEEDDEGSHQDGN